MIKFRDFVMRLMQRKVKRQRIQEQGHEVICMQMLSLGLAPIDNKETGHKFDADWKTISSPDGGQAEMMEKQ